MFSSKAHLKVVIILRPSVQTVKYLKASGMSLVVSSFPLRQKILCLLCDEARVSLSLQASPLKSDTCWDRPPPIHPPPPFSHMLLSFMCLSGGSLLGEWEEEKRPMVVGSFPQFSSLLRHSSLYRSTEARRLFLFGSYFFSIFSNSGRCVSFMFFRGSDLWTQVDDEPAPLPLRWRRFSVCRFGSLWIFSCHLSLSGLWEMFGNVTAHPPQTESI